MSITLDYSATLPFEAETVEAWHRRAGAYQRLLPPWWKTRVVREETDAGGRHLWVEDRLGPLRWSLEYRHFMAEPGACRDQTTRGSKRMFDSEHRFIPQTEGCRVEDRLHATHGGWEMVMERVYQFRYGRMLHDLKRHATWDQGEPWRIAITGATGLVGSALTHFLRAGGHRVLCIGRGAERTPDDVQWNPATRTLSKDRLQGVDAVVHLAGHNIASGFWTGAEKQRILDSRVVGTRFLCESLAELSPPPRVLVSGSAVGIYGGLDATPVDETAPVGPGFLADVCRQWEAATAPAEAAGIRTVHLRTAVVLRAMIDRMQLPFLLGLGATLGRGTQMMSWVSLDDLLGMVGHAIFTPSLSGPINAGSPEPVSAAVFSQTLARVLHRSASLRVPSIAIQTALGDLGREVLLQGCAAVPKRLLDSGFDFFYPTLEAGLAAEVS